MRTCERCGQPSEDAAGVCGKCGHEFKEAATPGLPLPDAPPGRRPPGEPGRTWLSPILPLGYQESERTGYAGFWIRFLAFLIDASIVGSVFAYPARFFSIRMESVLWTVLASSVLAVMALGIFLTYQILMTGRFQATLGKIALRLKVVRADGSPVDYRVATVRELSKILSALILFIGFIMAGFSGRKQALHSS